MMLKKLGNKLPLFIVILLAVFISYLNYTPETFLSGWDTLHPEFNLSLYTERVFFGAWQEHQGLGAPAAQAHTAEISRLPLLYFLSLTLNQNQIRYAFFFLMYIIGGLGAYLYISDSWFAEKSSMTKWAAANGSIFFLLNLVTLQQFYVPLEMFAVHFASIGFVLWSIDKALSKGRNIDFFLFFIIQFLTSSSAHTATLFFMFAFLSAIYGLILAIAKLASGQVDAINRLLILGLLAFLAHWYWMGPNAYYIFEHSNYVKDAKISRNFSNEAFWQNQAYGKLNYVLIGKNFLFNWQDFDYNQMKFVDLFDEWNQYFQSGLPVLGLYFISFLSIIGLIKSGNCYKKHNSQFFPLLFIFLLSGFFLINLNPPSSFLFQKIKQIGLLEEALRFPFTKFSIAFIFTISVFLSSSIYYLAHYLSRLPLFNKTTGLLFSVSLVVSINIFAMWPAFGGHLISDKMRVSIPNDYFELFKKEQKEPRSERIVKLPFIKYWGWVYNDWPGSNQINPGYQGAGFTWFGLLQPTIDREFDRWVNTNEFAYLELDFAVSDKSVNKFLMVLEKYDISQVLYDKSLINPHSDNPINPDFYSELFNVLEKDQSYDSPIIANYKYKNFDDTFVKSPSFITWVDANTIYVRQDFPYKENGNYIQSTKDSIIYPFSQLMAERINNVSVSDDLVTITNKLLASSNTYALQAANNYLSEGISISVDGQPLGLNDKSSLKGSITVQYQSQPTNINLQLSEVSNCSQNKMGNINKSSTLPTTYLAQDKGIACDGTLLDIDPNQSYILHFKGKNILGRSVKFYLADVGSKQTIIEDLLPEGEFDVYYSLPVYENSTEYYLSWETRSFGQESVNEISEISFYSFPIEEVAALHLVPDVDTSFANPLQINSSKRIANFLYSTTVSSTSNSGIITLSQSHDPAWIAIGWKMEDGRWNNFQLLPHYRYNGWANAWEVPPGDWQIIIIYWPQLLSFAGYGMLIVTFIVLIKKTVVELKIENGKWKIKKFKSHPVVLKEKLSGKK